MVHVLIELARLQDVGDLGEDLAEMMREVLDLLELSQVRRAEHVDSAFVDDLLNRLPLLQRVVRVPQSRRDRGGLGSGQRTSAPCVAFVCRRVFRCRSWFQPRGNHRQASSHVLIWDQTTNDVSNKDQDAAGFITVP